MPPSKALALVSCFCIVLSALAPSGLLADPPALTPAPRLTAAPHNVPGAPVITPVPAGTMQSINLRARSLPSATPKVRAPAPLRIAPPSMGWPIALGNQPLQCRLADSRAATTDDAACLQAIQAGKLQVVFGWFPCASTTCATQVTHFELYKVPRLSSLLSQSTSATRSGGLTVASTDVPIPTLVPPLPNGALLVAAGPMSVPRTRLSTFVANFRSGDCFAARVQSSQGFFSGLGSMQCVDAGTKTGMTEFDIPMQGWFDLTPITQPNVRQSNLDMLLHFDMRRATAVWDARLAGDGSARCLSLLARTRWDWLQHGGAVNNWQTLETVPRSGDILNDGVKSWAIYPDLSIRLAGTCLPGLKNFRVHVIAAK